MPAGETKSAAKATNLGCSGFLEGKRKLAADLLDALHVAVMSVEVCSRSRQQQLSQERSAAGCQPER